MAPAKKSPPAKKSAAKSASKKATAKETTAKKTSPKKKSASKNTAADAIDQQLARYQSMRDFNITAEPSGEIAPSSKEKASSKTTGQQLPFVIQKHAASHLHYDFRLGWNGVLKSWAVAKGPSYVTADKRLAVQVEDHPMEYGGFEGIIPKGQYGGGTVMLWDHGTWEPQPAYPDVDAGLRDGSLKFILHGTKLKGKWALIRMKGGKYGTDNKPGAKPNWLLIKEHDPFERTDKDPPITEEAPNSVVTGRSIEQIAASEDHVWNSKDTANPNAKAWHRNDKSSDAPALATSTPKVVANTVHAAAPAVAIKLPQAPKEPLPPFIPPQLASQATAPPSAAGWLHELKLDGYRIQARKNGSQVQLLTRTGLDWTHRMKSIATAVATLPAQTAILDGEVVVLAPNGTTSFADLQAAFQNDAQNRTKHDLTYFVFDLLHLNSRNLRNLPLAERKATLAQLLQSAPERIRLSEHLDTDGAAVFRGACELHAEGIVSKRADAAYASDRSSSWLKIKCIREQEFVIGGFTLPAKGHAGIHGIGALSLGYYDDSCNLIYAGRTGTGFTQKTHSLIRTKLDKLRTTTNPFYKPPAEARNGIIPIKPTLVAQVRFATWTADNLVRQASFQGLREDKPATEVRREVPTITPEPRSAKPAVKQASLAPPLPLAAKQTSAPKKTDRVPHSSAASSRKGGTKNPPASSTPTIRLTHPDKILDAESNLTKQQLADYYWAIAPHMLPQIAGRPLSLVRCPEGAGHPCFFQKHVNATLPPGIESVDVPDKKTGKIEPYITLSTPEALAGLAQLGVLEIHPWGSRNEDLEHPDRIIIDLDPDAAFPWRTLADSAAEIRKQLKKLSLESFLKSTGGKGLHVVVPIEPKHDWSTVKQFAHALVLQLEKVNPTLYLTKMSKAARAGKIYLDYLRNERGATAVAAFSPRARMGAPVSLPLSWSDLDADSRPHFQVSTYEVWKPRLSRDPWKQLPQTRQSLTADALASLKVTA
jgi:bifunctional non-homologous end joining protein LigD